MARGEEADDAEAETEAETEEEDAGRDRGELRRPLREEEGEAGAAGDPEENRPVAAASAPKAAGLMSAPGESPAAWRRVRFACFSRAIRCASARGERAGPRFRGEFRRVLIGVGGLWEAWVSVRS